MSCLLRMSQLCKDTAKESHSVSKSTIFEYERKLDMKCTLSSISLRNTVMKIRTKKKT